MKLVYTEHAIERMAERDIDDAQVKFALACGRRAQAADGAVEARTKRLTVVYTLESDFMLIVTAYLNEKGLYVDNG